MKRDIQLHIKALVPVPPEQIAEWVEAMKVAQEEQRMWKQRERELNPPAPPPFCPHCTLIGAAA